SFLRWSMETLLVPQTGPTSGKVLTAAPDPNVDLGAYDLVSDYPGRSRHCEQWKRWTDLHAHNQELIAERR
ncbi:MAG: hypothetical protein ACE5MM_06485, partial [Nitrospiraceae bacterium]